MGKEFTITFDQPSRESHPYDASYAYRILDRNGNGRYDPKKDAVVKCKDNYGHPSCPDAPESQGVDLELFGLLKIEQPAGIALRHLQRFATLASDFRGALEDYTRNGVVCPSALREAGKDLKLSKKDRSTIERDIAAESFRQVKNEIGGWNLYVDLFGRFPSEQELEDALEACGDGEKLEPVYQEALQNGWETVRARQDSPEFMQMAIDNAIKAAALDEEASNRVFWRWAAHVVDYQKRNPESKVLEAVMDKFFSNFSREFDPKDRALERTWFLEQARFLVLADELGVEDHLLNVMWSYTITVSIQRSGSTSIE